MAKKKKKTTKKHESDECMFPFGYTDKSFMVFHWHAKCKFLSALIFAVAAIYTLGKLGYLPDISIWIKATLAIAFAFMWK